jgi:hypothetical protein
MAGVMSGYRSAGSDRGVKVVSARRVAFALALLVAGAAVAQVAAMAQETEQRTEPPPNAAPPPFGVLETLGRWLEDSKARIDNQIKSTADAAKDAAKDAAEKAGQATTGIMLGWPGTRVAQGRVRCAVAPNGAPDCTEAANALCRSKGFGPGKSMDINTAEKCPTWVWLSGRPAPEGTCKVETFVLQAACQ